MGTFELLFSPSNSDQFSLKCVSLRLIELPRDQAVFYTLDESSYRCLRRLKQ